MSIKTPSDTAQATAAETSPEPKGRKPHGVRFEPHEEAFLEDLERRMTTGQPGAKSYFSAAVREVVNWGMIAMRPEIYELARRLGVTPQEALRRVLEAGLRSL